VNYCLGGGHVDGALILGLLCDLGVVDIMGFVLCRFGSDVFFVGKTNHLPLVISLAFLSGFI